VPHIDPEQLTLVALGASTTSPPDAEHLDDCRICAAELRALREVSELGRETREETALPMPSEQVWQRIAAATGQPASTNVLSGPAPRRYGMRSLVAAAAAAAVMGAGGAVVVDRVVGPPSAANPAAEVVAEARLSALPTAPTGAAGTAQVVRDGEHQVLRLRMSGLPAPAGLYQIWLYDGDATMIPLGVLTGEGADVTIPDTIDISTFPIVDVSAQKVGQQEHGISVLQGNLS